MSTGRSFSRSSSVKVVACPSFSASSAGGGGERQPVSFPVYGDGGGGVDIGDLGRSLGLDPSTVRLNGHYLSSGPDLVSSVSWASILSFFAARGFPFGASDSNPIVVQGKAITFSGLCCHCGEEDESYVSFKRKMELEDERTSKRTRTSECDSNTTSSDGHCIKRTLENGDGNPFKKMKINGCNRGSQSPVFLDGDHPSLKRMLGGEDEIPSKRNRTECNAGKIEARDLLMRSSSLVDNGPLETPKTGESDSGTMHLIQLWIFPTKAILQNPELLFSYTWNPSPLSSPVVTGFVGSWIVTKPIDDPPQEMNLLVDITVDAESDGEILRWQYRELLAKGLGDHPLL